MIIRFTSAVFSRLVFILCIIYNNKSKTAIKHLSVPNVATDLKKQIRFHSLQTTLPTLFPSNT